jgi:hypothetical protein
MKIRIVGAELSHEDGRTDKTNLIVTFGNFANAPKNRHSVQRYESLINKVFKNLDSIVGILETMREIPACLPAFQERLSFPELCTKLTVYSFFISEYVPSDSIISPEGQ